MGGAVFVGHNVRFDQSFLDALATDAGFAELLPAISSFNARPSRMLKPNT